MDASLEAPEKAGNGQIARKNSMVPGGTLLTRKELCDSVRIGYRTFSRLRADGRGPAGTWVGGKLMFSASEVSRWLGRYTESAGQPNYVGGN